MDPQPDADTTVQIRKPRRTLPSLIAVSAAAYCLLALPELNAAQELQRYVCGPLWQGTTGARCFPGNLGLLAHVLTQLIPYASRALPAIALVKIGYRRTFWFPLLVPALVDAILSPTRTMFLSGSFYARSGAPAFHPPFWETSAIVWTLLRVALTLVPAAYLAFRARPKPITDQPQHLLEALSASLVISVVCFVPALIYRHDLLARLSVGFTWLDWSQLLPFATVFLVGAMLGVRRPWWPWLHALFPVLLIGGWAVAGIERLIDASVGEPSAGFQFVHEVAPFVAVCFVAALWVPIGQWMDRRWPDSSGVRPEPSP